MGIISNNGGSRAVPQPSNNPRTGRTGKLRASHFGLRHQNPLRQRKRHKPSFNGGRFLSDNNLSRNIAFNSNGGRGGSNTGARRNKISNQGYDDKFTPSIKLPSKYVTISHPVATVASLQTPSPSNYFSSTTSLPPLITGRPIKFALDSVYSNTYTTTNLPPLITGKSIQVAFDPVYSNVYTTTNLPPLITGKPIQLALDPVYSNASPGGGNSNNRPSRSFSSATVTGRPSTISINNNNDRNNFVITKNTKQELQNNVVIPIGAASGFKSNTDDKGFTDNVILDDKTEIISLKNLESKFKTFKAVNFFDQSKPNSDIKLFIPEQNTLTPDQNITTHAFERSVVGEPVISFVDELAASASSPSLIADNPTPPVSTPRMFNEILDIVAVSTSRPPAFDGQRFIKEIGPYPDVFATSSPTPRPSPFPIQNNNQQLIISTPKPRPVFQNSPNPTTRRPVFQNSNTKTKKPSFQTTNTFLTPDSPSVSGPNPNNNGANIRFPAEAFRNSVGRPQSQKEPLSEDLLNLVNSLRGRINGNNQELRQPKNNQINGGGKRKKNKNKKNKNKNKRKQKKKQQQKQSRTNNNGPNQQSKFNNAIRLISTSSLDGRLGRQAQKFGPNSAGPVVEGFPAGLPAATPEGVKIALSSPLGKHYFLKVNDTS